MKELALDYISQHGKEYLDAIGDNPRNREMLIALVTGAYLKLEESYQELEALNTDHWLKVDCVMKEGEPDEEVRQLLILVGSITAVAAKSDDRIAITTFEGGMKVYTYTVNASFQTFQNFMEVEQSANISTLKNYR